MDICDVRKEIGRRIKAFRKHNNYTQEKFCEIIGLEQPNLSNIENGKNLPDIITLFSLIEKGKIEPNFLFDFFLSKKEKYSTIDYEMFDLLLSLPQDSKMYMKNILENIKMVMK